MVGPPPVFGGPQPQNHGLAIASLIVGIISVFPGCCCGGFGMPLPIAAIVMGIIAHQKIKAMPYEYTGGGFAIAGIVLASLGLMFDVFSMFSTIDDSMRSHYGAGF